MASRFLRFAIVLAGLSSAAATEKDRPVIANRAASSAAPQLAFPAGPLALIDNRSASLENLGAELKSGFMHLVPLPSTLPTFVEEHSALVENDLMFFRPSLMGIIPTGRPRHPELFEHALPVVVKKYRVFAMPSEIGDELEVRRDQDRLLLFRDPLPANPSAVGLGVTIFSVTTVLSAHTPRPLRLLFDGPVHLGPAVFYGGGLGAGIAGRGW